MKITDSDFARLSQSVRALEQAMQEMRAMLEQILQQESYATQPDLMVVAERVSGGKLPRITNPGDIYELMKHLSKLDQEELHVLCLNRKNMVTYKEMVFRGTMDSSIIDPRDIFRLALRKRAVQLILVHNHPSGQPEPSAEDIRATREIASAGKLMKIPVLDHVIIGENRFISLKERGLLE